MFVFFDNILVYNQTREDHLQHLKVLETLQKQQLYSKLSKCIFGTQEVEYLGYIISKEEVQAASKKISAMLEWPIPKTLKSLRGFLASPGTIESS